jgi:hypothetical protein
MGYMCDHALIVSGRRSEVEQARDAALTVYNRVDTPFCRSFAELVSPIIHGMTNGRAAFMVAPDGSKEGWSTSDLSDELRGELIAWLRSNTSGLSFVEVLFNDDDLRCRVERHDVDHEELR